MANKGGKKGKNKRSVVGTLRGAGISKSAARAIDRVLRRGSGGKRKKGKSKKK